MFRRAHRLHFVGIGGIGMSGIAEVLLNLRYDVRGSDLTLSPVTARLERLGATIWSGHDAAHVGDADVVVISSAVRADNPEVREARQRGIPVIQRGEMLAELMRLKYGIAVAGTHGKTTVTSLVATVLGEGGIDPTVVIGGRLKSLRSNARLGEGEYLVAEADESDGSFLRLIPTIAVVTNIDPEHLDHWTGGLPQIVDAFVDFVNKVPFYGSAVLCLDHPTVQAALPRLDRRFVTYGFSAQADYAAEQVEATQGAMGFLVRAFGQPLGRVLLKMIGRHNVLNALAAIAVADEVGVGFEVAKKALGEFKGISRRFEVKGEEAGVLVVDDYGHHPAEIAVTLEAARESYHRRLVVAFQPHRYTRTRDLCEEFSTAFNASHVLLVADIYAASEDPIPTVSAPGLVDRIRAHGHGDVRYAGPHTEVATRLREIVKPGDLVLTLGAGNIWQAGEELLAYLRGLDGKHQNRQRFQMANRRQNPRPARGRNRRTALPGGTKTGAKKTGNMTSLVPWMLAGLILVGAVTAVFFGYQALSHSARLRVKSIEVLGSARTRWAELEAYTGIHMGDRILAVDLDAAALGLRRHPWIEDATVRRRLPDHVALEVTEHTPAILVSLGEIYIANHGGDLFKRVAAVDGITLPVLTGLSRLGTKEAPAESAAIIREAVALGVAIAQPEVSGALGRLEELHWDGDLGWSVFVLRRGGGRLLVHLGFDPVLRLDHAMAACRRLAVLKREPVVLWADGPGHRVQVAFHHRSLTDLPTLFAKAGE